MQPLSDGDAVFLGLISVAIGNVFGWINFPSILSALFLGAAGSAGGYLTKLMLTIVIKKIKLKINQKKPKLKR